MRDVLRRPGGSRPRFPAVLAALLLPGCFLDFSGSWEADEVVCDSGLRVKWNGQGDRESLCPVVTTCVAALRDAVGDRFADDAAVEFVADTLPPCLADHVAGCFTPDFDHIYLAHAERIGDTALCHELLHRAFFFERSGDPDYGHTDALWKALP